VRAPLVVKCHWTLPLVGVGGCLPGGEFGVEEVDVVDAPVEALAGQRGRSISATLSRDPCLGCGGSPVSARVLWSWAVEDVVLVRPARSVPTPVLSASEPARRGLREISPTGYSGGECYRALTEVLLAGGDFLSDRFLLAEQATRDLARRTRCRAPTLWRFLAGADLGRVPRAAAVNRVMLRRAWAAGAAPDGDRLTIDPDATRVAVYGPGKEGSAFCRTGQTALSRLVGVLGETGDVLALRVRPPAGLVLGVAPDVSGEPLRRLHAVEDDEGVRHAWVGSVAPVTLHQLRQPSGAGDDPVQDLPLGLPHGRVHLPHADHCVHTTREVVR